MKIKIIYTEEELLNIEDYSVINTLIIDTNYAAKNLIIKNFTNLKIFSCCNTKIEKLEIVNCNALEILKISDNPNMIHLEAQSANFKLCSLISLPLLKTLDLRDINSVFIGSNNFFSLDLIKTGVEYLNLEYCLNLAGLVLQENTELNKIVMKDIYKLDSFYTVNNGPFNISCTHIGIKNKE